MQHCTIANARPTYEDRETSQQKTVFDFASALRANELILHYQPIVALGQGYIVGYEALARWRCEGVLFPPYKFVEELNRSCCLGPWLSSQVRQINEVLRYLPPHQWVSLNISREALRLPDLDTILGQCQYRTRLRLEVSESVPLGDYEIGAIRELHRHYHLAADDFGCQGSDFGRLIEAELFDTIKLDARITQGVATDPRKGKICAFVLGLIETLKMAAIAEWIEDSQQAHWLQEYGCAYGQGALFGMPDQLFPDRPE